MSFRQVSGSFCLNAFKGNVSIHSRRVYKDCIKKTETRYKKLLLYKIKPPNCVRTNFFNFFDWDQKYNCLRHHFQYLTQSIAPRGGSRAIQIFSILDYGTSFAVVSTALDFPSS